MHTPKAAILSTSITESEDQLIRVRASCRHLTLTPSTSLTPSLSFTSLTLLEVLSIESDCARDITDFALIDAYPHMSSITIKSDCFKTSPQSGGSFIIKGLNELCSITIGRRSFRYYKRCEIQSD